jgi:hypothetical protein
MIYNTTPISRTVVIMEILTFNIVLLLTLASNFGSVMRVIAVNAAKNVEVNEL